MSSIVLEPCHGPPCTRCGCQDVEILAPPREGGQAWWNAGRAKCRHCGKQFYFRAVESPPFQPPPPMVDPEELAPPAEPPPAPAVPEKPARVIPLADCPDCGMAMQVTHTYKTMRRHKCPRCGKTLKTPRTDL